MFCNSWKTPSFPLKLHSLIGVLRTRRERKEISVFLTHFPLAQIIGYCHSILMLQFPAKKLFLHLSTSAHYVYRQKNFYQRPLIVIVNTKILPQPIVLWTCKKNGYPCGSLHIFFTEPQERSADESATALGAVFFAYPDNNGDADISSLM
jgi:hypothetical protein